MSESHEGPGPTVPAEVAPPPVSTARVIWWGLVVWAVALVATLAVPALHEGERDWWPWTCVTGLALGLFGLWYVRRGRGNAATAE
jgi:Protein of unknown function (DUF2530)